MQYLSALANDRRILWIWRKCCATGAMFDSPALRLSVGTHAAHRDELSLGASSVATARRIVTWLRYLSLHILQTSTLLPNTEFALRAVCCVYQTPHSATRTLHLLVSPPAVFRLLFCDEFSFVNMRSNAICSPAYLLLLLIVITGYFIYPHAQLFIYDKYAHLRISAGGWQRAWKNFPLDDRLFCGSRGLERSRTTSDQLVQHIEGSQLLKTFRSSGADLCEYFEGRQLPLDALQLSARNASQLGLPPPSLGSYSTLELELDVCYDRKDRWAAYGLLTNESAARSLAPSANWDGLDLGNIQQECFERNRGRLQTSDTRKRHQRQDENITMGSRTAIVLRAWDGFTWTGDDVRNVRAMVTELSLASGGEYQIFVLLHVKNETSTFTVSDLVPEEFRNMTEVWTYNDTRSAYLKVGESESVASHFTNRITMLTSLSSVYYHTFMALQLFAERHPEFDFFWNWEMDVRYTGHYGHFLQTASEWSAKQRREQLWERNARFYIPSYHGSYDSFADMVSSEVESTDRFGHHDPREAEERSPASSKEPASYEEADLITFFPMFEPAGTLWPYKDYIVNYNAADAAKPRRVAVGTNARFSRSLLLAMHRENQDLGHGMMSEMWPPTVALQNDMKAVAVPHAVMLDRRWPAQSLEEVFNAGDGGQVGSSLSTVINQEHNFKGSTYYYNSQFALDLYKRWMGLASHGPGSPAWEVENGRMCLPGLLLHPVKSSRLGT